MKSLIILCALLSVKTFSYRLNPIVVSSKTETNSLDLTSSHVVIDQSEVEKETSDNVIDSLKDIPGISIRQSGGPGSQTTINIRGTELRHTLVLIDGVKVNDSSNTDRHFNFATLSNLNIDRIEVLKGSQTVLYGPEAIGGVINIITKKGGYTSVGVEAGFQQGVNGALSMHSKRGVMQLNFQTAESEGINILKEGAEKDGYQKKNFNIHYAHAFDDLEAEWSALFLDDFVETDGLVDDPEANNKTQQQVYTQKLIKEVGGGELKHTIAHNRTDRLVKYNFGGYQVDHYQGTNTSNEVTYTKKMRVGAATFGLFHEYESLKKSNVNEVKANLYSAYVSTQHKIKNVIFNIGLRNDTHEAFGSRLNYNLGLGKDFGARKALKFNLATGMKAPSLYQLYVERDFGSVIGNEDLAPEKSQSMDLTYTKKGKTSYEFSLFETRIVDYFFFDFTEGYQNQGDFRSYGLEGNLSHSFGKWMLKEGVNLSKFESEDEVLRRPTETYFLGIDYEVTDTQNILLDWNWNSSSFDQSGGETVSLDAFDTLDLNYQYAKNEHNFNVGVKNLLDRDYEMIAGRSVLGRNIFMRYQYKFQ